MWISHARALVDQMCFEIMCGLLSQCVVINKSPNLISLCHFIDLTNVSGNIHRLRQYTLSSGPLSGSKSHCPDVFRFYEEVPVNSQKLIGKLIQISFEY